MHILLVEDEPKVSSFLSQGLKLEGYSLVLCETTDEVRAFIANNEAEADLVILDRMLHGDDGSHLILGLKKRFPDAFIFVLSAIGTADEKAQVLDLGADDYLTKPFSFSELTARIRALQRRPRKNSQESYLVIYRDLTLDLRNQAFFCKNNKMDLSKKEFQVLALFVQNPGRVYNKFQLLDRVWDIQADIESNVVEVTLKNIRKKLKEEDSSVEILSRRNVGYWIEA